MGIPELQSSVPATGNFTSSTITLPSISHTALGSFSNTSIAIRSVLFRLGVNLATRIALQATHFNGFTLKDVGTKLSAFFGVGARQDINFLYIKKDSLPGLTPAITNHAESIKVALDRQFLEVGQKATTLINADYYRIEALLGSSQQRLWIVSNYLEPSATDDFTQDNVKNPLNPSNFESE